MAGKMLILLMCVYVGYGFNVDLDSRVIYRGNPGSMFGFAVQEHVEYGQKWVLVGAPEDDTRRRPSLIRPGAVYKCDAREVAQEVSCQELIFDHQGDNFTLTGRQIEQKSHQWFGASIASTGIDGPVVACAPRYVLNVPSQKNPLFDPVGSCFIAKDSFKDITEVSPCRNGLHGHDHQGTCEAGFSSAISKDGKRLFLGAPGSWYWQGQTFSIDPSSRFPFKMPQVDEQGQLFSRDLEARQPVVKATLEASSINDDTYMGYSVTVGDFAGHAGLQGVAVGVPRGSELKGLVVLYTWDLDNIHNISGSQIGAYFGYSLASGDIDGDGQDDVIVGAPMYTVKNNEGSFEHGRVYVIYQGRAEYPYQLSDFLTGEVSRGRFGLSVAALNDINMDGFGDFAVGAPYSGANGNGMVFIYHGSKHGIRKKPSQIIRGEDAAPNLRTFGFSLSGGVDLDDNLYTDLVVGAYKSSAAVLFKSRPVVKVTASVKFLNVPNKLVSLKNGKCKLLDGTEVPCVDVYYCMQYTGINVDTHIAFELSLKLDSQLQSSRMFLRDNEGVNVLNQTLFLNKEEIRCENTSVYIINDPRDKLTPLEVSLTFNLKNDPYQQRSSIRPVLDMNSDNVEKDAINIQKNCGKDNVCIPNMKMKITPSVSKYLYGSSEKFNIEVFIENSGEDAFEARYWLQLPPGVYFSKVERLETGKVDKTPVYCSPPEVDESGNNTMKCDIGNPLPSGQMVHFKVILEPFYVKGMAASYEFQMEANSTNPERDDSKEDNTYHLSVPVWFQTDLIIQGVSYPPDLHYNASQYMNETISQESELGPQVIHEYAVRNNGPSAVEAAEVFLMWPYQTLAGEDLFYVVVEPETSGDIACEMAPHINDRNLYIERPDKSYLELVKQGMIDANTGLTLESSSSFRDGSSKTSSSSSSSTGKGIYTLEEKRKIEEKHRKYEEEYHRGNDKMDWSKPPEDVGLRGKWDESQGWSSSSSQNQNVRGTNQYNSQTGNRDIQSQSRNQYGINRSQYGRGGSQSGTTGTQYGSNEIQHGSSGTQYGNSGTQYGSSGSQYGSSGTQYGSSGNQYGSSGSQYEGGGSVSGNSFTGSRVGTGPVVVRTKYWNTTTTIDENGKVHKTETSTEYTNLGHEGEAGSSFSNRFGESGTYEGASTSNTYGSANSYNQHSGTRAQGSDSYNQNSGTYNRNTDTNGNFGQNSGGVAYDSSRGVQGWQGAGRHTWSTEETVNKDLINAGSRSFIDNAGSSDFINRGAGESSSSGSSSVYQPRTTVVGGEEDNPDLGLGSVAYNPNNEFRAQGLDLGVSSRGSTSQSGSGYSQSGGGYSQSGSHQSGGSAQNGGSQSRAYQSGSSGSYNGGSSNGYAQSGTVHGGLAQGGEETYSNSYSGGAAARSGSSYNYHQSQHNAGSYAAQSSYTSKPTNYQWSSSQSQRVKRQEPYEIDQDLEALLTNCSANFKCAVMRCETGRLAKNQEVWLALRGRVNAKVLNEMSKERSVILSSLLGARVTRLPYIGKPQDSEMKTYQALTHVTPQLEDQSQQSIPLWVVVLAACAGALLLLLLILLLYKCGFFKRNRPSDQAERQPLNRNGYHADEHL